MLATFRFYLFCIILYDVRKKKMLRPKYKKRPVESMICSAILYYSFFWVSLHSKLGFWTAAVVVSSIKIIIIEIAEIKIY
jgi:hypothetical protein